MAQLGPAYNFKWIASLVDCLAAKVRNSGEIE